MNEPSWTNWLKPEVKIKPSRIYFLAELVPLRAPTFEEAPLSVRALRKRRRNRQAPLETYYLSAGTRQNFRGPPWVAATNTSKEIISKHQQIMM